MPARREWSEIFHVLRGKKNPTNLEQYIWKIYPTKKDEKENIQKILREFICQ
jgi:hypothetical protein